MAALKRILLLSRGDSEGAKVGNKLFGENIFQQKSKNIEANLFDKYGKTMEVTNLPLMLGNESENDSLRHTRAYLTGRSYDAVIIIMALRLDLQATAENEQYVRVLRKLVEKKYLQKNAILVFKSLNHENMILTKSLSREIEEAKLRPENLDTLGSLVMTVHGKTLRSSSKNPSFEKCFPLATPKNVARNKLVIDKAFSFTPFTFHPFGSSWTSLRAAILILFISIIMSLVLRYLEKEGISIFNNTQEAQDSASLVVFAEKINALEDINQEKEKQFEEKCKEVQKLQVNLKKENDVKAKAHEDLHQKIHENQQLTEKSKKRKDKFSKR